MALRIDPNGRLLLVANYDAKTVTAFAINAATGGLSGAVTIPVGSNPSDLAMDRTGTFFYVANDGDASVSAFRLGVNGALSTIVGSPIATDAGPVAVAVDPSGQVLYVATENNNAVTAYTITAGTGGLTRGATIHTWGTPTSLTVTGSASAITYTPTFAYVANTDSNNVSAYSVDPATGLLSAIAGSPFVAGPGPVSIALDRFNRYVYTANGASPLIGGNVINMSGFTVNPATGALTAISPVVDVYFTLNGFPSVVAADVLGLNMYLGATSLGANSAQTIVSFFLKPGGVLQDRTGNIGCGTSSTNTTSAIGVDPIGRGAYRANREVNSLCIYQIRLPAYDQLWVLDNLADVPTGNAPTAVIVEPLGRYVYVTNQSDNSVSAYRITSSNLALASIGTTPTGTGPNSLACEPSGQFCFVSHQGANTVATLRINQATGVVTVAGALPTGSLPSAMAVDPSGRYVCVTNRGDNTISMFGLDGATGLLTAKGTVATGVGPKAITVPGSIQ